MTVTTYIADFTDANGGKFHGSIAWDKHTPRRLDAQVGRVLPNGIVDFACWKKSVPNTARRERALTNAMKREALARGWRLVTEEYTHLSPNFNTPRAILLDVYQLLRDARAGDKDARQGLIDGGICEEVLERAEKFLYPPTPK